MVGRAEQRQVRRRQDPDSVSCTENPTGGGERQLSRNGWSRLHQRGGKAETLHGWFRWAGRGGQNQCWRDLCPHRGDGAAAGEMSCVWVSRKRCGQWSSPPGAALVLRTSWGACRRELQRGLSPEQGQLLQGAEAVAEAWIPRQPPGPPRQVGRSRADTGHQAQTRGQSWGWISRECFSGRKWPVSLRDIFIARGPCSALPAQA